MIPGNIDDKHVMKALLEIDRQGVPAKRKIKRYYLPYNGRRYPPKYVVSIANKYANGHELPWDSFYGGKETNDFLSNLGFRVI